MWCQRKYIQSTFQGKGRKRRTEEEQNIGRPVKCDTQIAGGSIAVGKGHGSHVSIEPKTNKTNEADNSGHDMGGSRMEEGVEDDG